MVTIKRMGWQQLLKERSLLEQSKAAMVSLPFHSATKLSRLDHILSPSLLRIELQRQMTHEKVVVERARLMHQTLLTAGNTTPVDSSTTLGDLHLDWGRLAPQHWLRENVKARQVQSAGDHLQLVRTQHYTCWLIRPVQRSLKLFPTR